MRNKFADTLYEISKTNEKICALVADISPAGSMEKFRNEHPSRFINTGVAEQSMIGIAAGLAIEGFRPFCYTIATFALYRPFEFIRVDLAYQNLPVTIIGMGAGLIYSTLGSTHHTIEDIAIASCVPNMTVLAPCDPDEMKYATQWCAEVSMGPTYMRLGKAGEPALTTDAPEPFLIGKIRCIKKGKKIAIISYGSIMNLVVSVSNMLEAKEINASIYSMHTIKPFDTDGVLKILRNYDHVVIIEEHVKSGSVGVQVKSLAYDANITIKISHYHLRDQFIHSYGTYESLLGLHGISSEKIVSELSG